MELPWRVNRSKTTTGTYFSTALDKVSKSLSSPDEILVKAMMNSPEKTIRTIAIFLSCIMHTFD